jgi:hypothetical protein
MLTEYQPRTFPIVCTANGQNLRAMIKQRPGGQPTGAFLYHAPGIELDVDSPPPIAIRLGTNILPEESNRCSCHCCFICQVVNLPHLTNEAAAVYRLSVTGRKPHLAVRYDSYLTTKCGFERFGGQQRCDHVTASAR